MEAIFTATKVGLTGKFYFCYNDCALQSPTASILAEFAEILPSHGGTMKHLMNILAGVGSAINALGTAPQYDLPRRGDQAKDLTAIAGDFRGPGKYLNDQATKTLAGNNGQINYGARQRAR